MHRQLAHSSGLPSCIMPCPQCGTRMTVKSIEPALLGVIGIILEDITHSCVECGTELVRTVQLQPN